MANYDFVPYHKPETRRLNASETTESGFVELELYCLSPLFVGSGLSDFNDKDLYSTTARFCGKAIIPGSSLKGAARSIASAVSTGCLPNRAKQKADGKRKYLEEQISIRNANCEASGERCIICDTFGMMGFASKVSFCDMVSENAEFDITSQAKQFSPDISASAYNDDHGYSTGYKFYKTHCEATEYRKVIKVETVRKGSIFKGKVFFDRLTDAELSLLLFSLGLDGSIDLKLGGYRNEGLGVVRTSAILMLGGKETDAKAIAARYPTCYGQKCAAQTSKLREILSPLKEVEKRA